jgi:hypothetical protein
LGAVLLARQDLPGAEKWLQAAWSLSEDAATARRLADVYRQMKNATLADRYALFADAVAPPVAGAPASADPDRLFRVNDIRTEASKGRMASFPKPVAAERSADLFLAISPSGEVTDVRVVQGTTGPNSIASAVRGLKFAWLPPDETLKQVIRRASVQCVPTDTQCTVYLRRTGEVTSVD